MSASESGDTAGAGATRMTYTREEMLSHFERLRADLPIPASLSTFPLVFRSDVVQPQCVSIRRVCVW